VAIFQRQFTITGGKNEVDIKEKEMKGDAVMMISPYSFSLLK